MLRSLRIPMLAALGAATLSACVSFGAKPPPTLMTLHTAAPLAPGAGITARPGASITVAVPAVPPELGGLRVPVRAGPNAIAYLRNAQWGDAPARLFRNLLAETIAARTGRVTLEPRQYLLAPGAQLTGRLVDFGLDATTGQAVATFDAMLVRQAQGALESRRFQAKAPAAAQNAAGIAAALSQASNQIASEVADWVGAP
jgi:cholesterol transport system auxiliary component